MCSWSCFVLHCWSAGHINSDGSWCGPFHTHKGLKSRHFKFHCGHYVIIFKLKILLHCAFFKPYVKLYWTSVLQMFHKRRDEKHRSWVAMGRPRDNDSEIWVSYKEAKRNFRQEKRRAEAAYELKEEYDIQTAEGINQNYSSI